MTPLGDCFLSFAVLAPEAGRQPTERLWLETAIYSLGEDGCPNVTNLDA
jgi:hypothetical protein